MTKGMSQGTSLGNPPFNIRRSMRLKVKREVGRKFDHISNLPDHIVHQILTYLPTKKVTQTSILSKTWYSMWGSYFVHDYDEMNFAKQYDQNICRLLFHNSIAESLHRPNPDGTTGPPTVNSLRVNAVYKPDSLLQAYIDTFIGIGINRSKLENLDITVESSYGIEKTEDYPNELYAVPEFLFAAAKFLTSLKLQACECGPFEPDTVAHMPSLKSLLLKYSSIDDNSIERLISGCPVLEDLDVEFCFGFDKLKVTNPVVKQFKLSSCEDLSSVQMDTPGLRLFEFVGSPYRFDYPEIDKADESAEILEFGSPKGSEGFRSLVKVTFSNLRMEAEAMEAMLSCFTRIERVSLNYCTIDTIPLKFSPRLETLEIQSCEYEDLIVDSESLQSVSIQSYMAPVDHIFDELPDGKFMLLRKIVISGYINFPGKIFEFSGGPCLESLTIEACADLTFIKIVSSSIKTLQIIKCEDLEEAVIGTPRLTLFKYVGQVVQFSPMVCSEDAHVDLHLMSPSSRVTVDAYEHKLWFFYKSFETAKYIKISSDKAQYMVTQSRSKFRPPICCPDELEVRTAVGKIDYKNYLINVMNISLCFKKLDLNMFSRRVELEFATPSDMSHFERRKNNQCTNSHCCLSHLYSAKFKFFDGSSEDMEMIAYLAEEARNLKAIDVDFRGYIQKNRAHDIMAYLLNTHLKKIHNLVCTYSISGQDI